MSNIDTQKCLTINKENIDIIDKAVEEYWAYDTHDSFTINKINDTRTKITDIKEYIGKLNEIKICWG